MLNLKKDVISMSFTLSGNISIQKLSFCYNNHKLLLFQKRRHFFVVDILYTNEKMQAEMKCNCFYNMCQRYFVLNEAVLGCIVFIREASLLDVLSQHLFQCEMSPCIQEYNPVFHNSDKFHQKPQLLALRDTLQEVQEQTILYNATPDVFSI